MSRHRKRRSISRSCSTRCGEKNLAKLVRCRSVSLRRSVTDRFFNERNVVTNRHEAHDGSEGRGPRNFQAVGERVAQDSQRDAGASGRQDAPPLAGGGGDQHDDDVEHGDSELQRADAVEDEDADAERARKKRPKWKSLLRHNKLGYFVVYGGLRLSGLSAANVHGQTRSGIEESPHVRDEQLRILKLRPVA